jgi:sortase A
MRPYRYSKVNTEAVFVQQYQMRERGKRIISTSFLFAGLSIFTYVSGFYYLWGVKETQLAQKPGLTPVLDTAPASAFTANLPVSRDGELNNPSAANASSDTEPVYPNFNIKVPKLKINSAIVTTDVLSDNEDIYKPVLLKSLAHYKGTAYPGEEGNVVVYGHSILPVFYNPNNYLSIFSTLDSLSAEDEISLSWGQKSYTYKVEGIEVVDPSDTRVLRYKNGKTLTLVTCVPPGYTTRRLLVFARLVE